MKGEKKMLSDATVTITKKEYENFLRESERINIVKRHMKKDGYISDSYLKIIFNFEESEGEK